MEKTNLGQVLKSSPLGPKREQAQKKLRSEKLWCSRTKAYQRHKQETLRDLLSPGKFTGSTPPRLSSPWAQTLSVAERRLTFITTWSLRAEEHGGSGHWDSLPGPFPDQ